MTSADYDKKTAHPHTMDALFFITLVKKPSFGA